MKHKTLRKILIALVTITVICSLAYLLGIHLISEAARSVGGWLSYDGGCLEWWGGPDDPEAIQTGAKIVLPPSTENLFAHSVAFQDCFVFVSFDMDASDLDAFLASTYVSQLNSVTGSQLGTLSNWLQNDVDWIFEAERTYLYGQGSDESGTSSQIVVEQMSSGTYRVYVATFLP